MYLILQDIWNNQLNSCETEFLLSGNVIWCKWTMNISILSSSIVSSLQLSTHVNSLSHTICLTWSLYQIRHPPKRRHLHHPRFKNPTAFFSAPPPTATSDQQVYTHTHTPQHTVRNVAIPTAVAFFSGSVYTLGELGRSDSCMALRSPKEEKPEIAQLRKVNIKITACYSSFMYKKKSVGIDTICDYFKNNLSI